MLDSCSRGESVGRFVGSVNSATYDATVSPYASICRFYETLPSFKRFQSTKSNKAQRVQQADRQERTNDDQDTSMTLCAIFI